MYTEIHIYMNSFQNIKHWTMKDEKKKSGKVPTVAQ